MITRTGAIVALATINDLPSFITNPTRALDRSNAVEGRLADLRGRVRCDSAAPGVAAESPTARSPLAIQNLRRTPDFTDDERWFNGRPLSLRRLRGRVVLIDFWTYTCINCLRPARAGTGVASYAFTFG